MLTALQQRAFVGRKAANGGPRKRGRGGVGVIIPRQTMSARIAEGPLCLTHGVARD